ncbi:MAG: sulfotransferase family 2 domain-containing protein [Pseudomonadota bacterium]
MEMPVSGPLSDVQFIEQLDEVPEYLDVVLVNRLPAGSILKSVKSAIKKYSKRDAVTNRVVGTVNLGDVSRSWFGSVRKREFRTPLQAPKNTALVFDGSAWYRDWASADEAGWKFPAFVLPSFDPSSMTRRGINVRSADVIYFPIHKVGYSSVRDTFKASFADFEDPNDDTHSLNEIVDLTAQPVVNSFKFSLVRSPHSRVLSAFREKIERTNYQKNLINYRRPLERLLGVKEISISDFVSLVEIMPDRHSDTHWRSQFGHVHHSSGALLVDKLWRLEDMQDMFDWLAKKTGTKIEAKRRNASAQNSHSTVELTHDLLDRVAIRYSDDEALYQSLSQK